jgi:peptide/nickel transport system ATP-binding protein
MHDVEPRQGGQPVVVANDLACHYTLEVGWSQRMWRGEERRLLKAVDGVDFAIRKGETFGLVGESGCGKSTLARLAVGLIRPTRGTLRLHDADIFDRPRDGRIQIIFQDPAASLDPRWRAADIIAEPLRARGSDSDKNVRHRVDELLSLVGLTPPDGDRFPHEFSGGQRQRISIARALACNPEFLVCDEPTSALDVSVQAQILNLMRDLQRQFDLTCLFISHNLAVIRQMADVVGVMYLGRIVELAPTDALFDRPAHPYTRMLIDAIPRLDSLGRLRPGPIGEVASPLDAPAGCAFHPRCPLVIPECRVDRPVRLPLGGEPGRSVACHVAHRHTGLPAQNGHAHG